MLSLSLVRALTLPLSRHNIFETEDKLMMVVELVKGGELFTRILDSGPFPEAEARPVIKQVTVSRSCPPTSCCPLLTLPCVCVCEPGVGGVSFPA